MLTLTFLKLGLQLPEPIQGLAGDQRKDVRVVPERKRRLASPNGHLDPDVGIERRRRRRGAKGWQRLKREARKHEIATSKRGK